MTDAQQVAARLGQLRRQRSVAEHRDIEADAIAAAIGVSAAAYSRYESGKRIPKEPYLGRLAEYYGVTRAYLRYGETSARETNLEPQILGPVSDEEKRASAERRAKKARAAGGRTAKKRA